MRIVVTGATGFLGQPVLQTLRSMGHEVVPLGRHDPVRCDLLDPQAVRRKINEIRPDGLVHLAWFTEHGVYWNAPDNLNWITASLVLLEAFAAVGGKRALIAGSSAEYRWCGTEDLKEMHSPLDMTTLYLFSKNTLREILHRRSKVVEDLSLVWTRVFCSFGPGEDHRRLVPRTVQGLLAGKRLEFDSACSVRDFLHVSDVASALCAVFQSQVSGPINIASGVGTSVRDLVSMIASHLNAQDQVHFDEPTAEQKDVDRVVACVSRLNQEVGWFPAETLNHRIREVCEFYGKLKKGFS